MLQVTGLYKSFSTQSILEDISFGMIPGERLGIIGRNGCGKSTLFKMILGEDHPDDGQIVMPKGYRVGHLAQHLKFTESTILDEAALGLPLERKNEEYKAKIILAGLGFSEEDFYSPPSAFSGGFQIRINLAKVLLSEPNLLLLDEPTNYLDIVSARWLARFLQEWPNELMIITHDREFMDNVTTHTMIIRRKQVRRIEGSSKKLLDQLSVDDEIYEKSRVNEDKKRKEVEEFINRFRAKASKASQVQSRVKALEKMGQKEELVDEVKLDFQFSQAPFAGKYILEVDNLEFGYKPEQTLIRRLGFTLAKGERIGVVGKNGRGKSTLLKLLAGELAPREGSVKLSPNAQLGYFGQTNISRLNEAKTIEQEVQAANSNLHRTKVRAICGTMMFPGDAAEKKISVLSGGERSRVLIGKILASPSNILLLDEPTNHLDIESIEALIESLKTYEGGIVIVTHNEHILRDLATKLVVFDGNTAQVIPGDYDYFLSTVGWGDDDASQMSSRRKEKDKDKSKGTAPAGNVNSAKLKSNAKDIANVEKEIGVLEKRLEVANEKMVQASQTQDRVGISSAGKEIADLENLITKAYEKFQQLLE